MELEKFSIPATNRFASLYLQQQQPVTDYFHYQITDSDVYRKRVNDLQKRTFQREKLVECIDQYMERFPRSEKVEESLLKLKHDGVVVIGGQQAGLLTGPLYSVHKIISIIALANQQERELGVPVIPVFWIAGEDHDYQEINHVFAFDEGKVNKLSYQEKNVDKQMVSGMSFDKDKMNTWIRSVFESFGETVHTKKLLAMVERAVQSSMTIVDLFSYIVMEMFKDYGLLIIDSADSSLRQIERPFFQQLLEKNETITKNLLFQQETIKVDGFEPMIDATEFSMNLFIQHNGERMLLERTEEGAKSKGAKKRWSIYELNNTLRSAPESFSNNVVTRPMMQEWLFPTLAFIAGPGEIAYWGELKKSFECMGLKMPPIIPRQNITILERDIEKLLGEFNETPEKVIQHGLLQEKNAFISSLKDESLHDAIHGVKEKLISQYGDITNLTETHDKGLMPLVEKNLAFHLKQLQFLEERIVKSNLLKETISIKKYDRVIASLQPNGVPQERIWNVFYYLNKHGLHFIHELTSLSYSWDGRHNLVKM
ncbi:bacillithiol biosynthesis cysteine-adding enzyme BshC [Bacillus spongiae]|uniref:Putative cysteine ligase BshC n=1 Tax=Bacillus spongiae TaxID=2683610 RepID=A0ABU8H9R7_9BACI